MVKRKLGFVWIWARGLKKVLFKIYSLKAICRDEYHNRYSKNIILGRTACLGNFVLNKYEKKYGRIVYRNQQKVRVDMFVDYIKGCPKPITKSVEDFFGRRDIIPLIRQQEELPWETVNYRKSLIMDSFAELTDQKFVSKESGAAFACHYSDIEHNKTFDELFECEGLMAIENMEGFYRDFFSLIENRYGIIPVYFIHFSTKLDNRIFYKKRADEIKRVMIMLEEEKSYIKNVFIDDDDVIGMDNDAFPYHYGEYTYNQYLIELERVMVS